MSFSINSLLNYFPSVKEFYDLSSQIWSIASPLIEASSKTMDCDVYTPPSTELIESEPEIRRIIDQSSTRGFDPVTVLADEFINQTSKNSIAVRNLSELNETDQPPENNLAKSVDRYGESPVRHFQQDIDSDIIDRAEKLTRVKESIEKNITNDKEFADFLDKCKTDGVFSIDDVSDSNKYDVDSIIDSFSDCFESDVPDSDFGDFSDIIGDPESGIDGVLRNPITQDIDSGDPDSQEENNVDDLDNVESYEPYSITPDAMRTLVRVLGDSSDCFTVMMDITDNLKEKTLAYSDLMSNKPEIEREYVCAVIYNEMLSGIYEGVDNFSPLGLLWPGDLKIFSDSVYDYSKEIAPDFKKRGGGLLFSYMVPEYKVVPLNPSEDKPGAYFRPYKELSKRLEADKFKNGSATEQDYVSEALRAEEEVVSMLSEWKGVVKKRSISDGGMIARSALASGGSVREITKIIRDLQNSHSSELKRAVDRYESFEKDKEALKDEIDSLAMLMESESERMGCSPQSPNTVSDDEIEIELGYDEDHRGMIDPSKPTEYDPDYWKRFASLVTKVGLAPIPQVFGNNEFRLNLGSPSDPKIKIPIGAPAIDDDGIPRFLFWPIGILIPTPFSADGLYRIPIPAYWRYMTMFTVDDPLRKIAENLSESILGIEGLAPLRNMFTPDDTLDRVWSSMPSGSVSSLLSIMNLDDQAPIRLVNELIAQTTQELNSVISGGISDIINEAISESNPDIDKLQRNIETYIASRSSDVQRWIDLNFNSVAEKIEDFMGRLDISSGIRTAEEFANTITDMIQIAEGLLSGITSCFDVNGPNISDSFKPTVDTVLDTARNISSGPFSPTDLITPPKYNVPVINLSDYAFVNRASLENVLLDGLDSVELYDIFPKMSFFVDQTIGSFSKFYNKTVKYNMWESGFDPRSLIEIDVPRELLSNLSLLKFNFPELTFVFFLANSGAFPYPYMLCINNSNTDVPGIIKPRSAAFVLTIDIQDPVKEIKREIGSFTLPLRTHVETIANQSLGIYYDPAIGLPLNLCDLPDFTFPYQNVLSEISSVLDPDFLGKSPIKNIHNPFELPSPDITCSLMRQKDYKDKLDSIMGGFRLNSSLLPPKLSKLSGMGKYGITDFDGDIMVDELRRTFDITSFPPVGDILGYPQQRNTMLAFSELGTAKKGLMDIMPGLTSKTPYLQDDFPSWERLHLGNIPFLFFLAEFLVAAKKGSRLPIPEIIGALDIN